MDSEDVPQLVKKTGEDIVKQISKADDNTERIIIAETKGDCKICADLGKCEVCQINFTTIQPCLMCSMRIEKEKELGRSLTKKEYDILFGWLE